MKKQNSPFTIVDLIQFESQLKRDQDMDKESLIQRDRPIGQEIQEQFKSIPTKEIPRSVGFKAWLHKLPSSSSHEVRANSEHGLKLLDVILMILGVLWGGCTSWLLLLYDGKHPVNLIHFLVVLIGVQFFLYGLFFYNYLSLRLFRKGKGDSPLGSVQVLVSKLALFLTHNPKSQVVVTKARSLFQLDSLKYFDRLYRTLEWWFILFKIQKMALFFNLSALAAFIYKVAFYDIAFAWNTTLPITSAQFTKFIHALSLPWSWLWQQAVPSADLIKNTQYFHLESKYGVSTGGTRALNVAELGEWWAFLLACLLVYAVLPRLILYLVSYFKVASLLKNLPFDSLTCDHLYHRLFRATVYFSKEDEQPIASALEASQEIVSLSSTSKKGIGFKWRDLSLPDDQISDLLEKEQGVGLVKIFPFGGADGIPSVEQLNAMIDPLGIEVESVFILVEAWESPTKSLLRFINHIKKSIGPRTKVYFKLVQMAESENEEIPRERIALWSRYIKTWNEPFVGVIGED